MPISERDMIWRWLATDRLVPRDEHAVDDFTPQRSSNLGALSESAGASWAACERAF